MSPRGGLTDAQKKRAREIAKGRIAPCRFPTRAGGRCRAFAVGSDDGCFSHTSDAAVVARRRAAISKGGQGNSTARRAMTLLMGGPFGPLLELIISEMIENHAGTIDPNRLNANAMALRAIVAARDSDVASRILERLDAQVRAMADGEETAAEVWVARDGTTEVSDGEGGYVTLVEESPPLLTGREDPS